MTRRPGTTHNAARTSGHFSLVVTSFSFSLFHSRSLRPPFAPCLPPGRESSLSPSVSGTHRRGALAAMTGMRAALAYSTSGR
jgi:hypothetical protein